MKNLAILFLCAFSVVLFSCENKRRAPSNLIPAEAPTRGLSQKGEAIRSLSPRGEATEKCDTIFAPIDESLKGNVKSEELSTEKRGESYSKRSEKSSYDNMRGFDPASEDDMDDNGMSRYMENDDEEGWE